MSKRKRPPHYGEPDQQRFEKAYKAFGRRHREMARTRFLGEHGLAEQTFYAKLSGERAVLPREADWMEAFTPEELATA